MLVWSRDVAILVSHPLPDSKVAREDQPLRQDTAPFNGDFKPDIAFGGTGKLLASVFLVTLVISPQSDSSGSSAEIVRRAGH